MPTKLQFNPSTLKTLFSSGTHKVQMAVAGGEGVCPYCSSGGPLQVEITFQDVVLCPGCTWYGPDLYNDWYKVSWVSPYNINDLHNLTWDMFSYVCTWGAIIEGVLHIERWSAEFNGGWACVEKTAEANLDLFIQLTRNEDRMQVTVSFGAEGWPNGNVFASGWTFPGSGKCVQGSVSNELECPYGTGDWVFGEAGSAAIVEI